MRGIDAESSAIRKIDRLHRQREAEADEVVETTLGKKEANSRGCEAARPR